MKIDFILKQVIGLLKILFYVTRLILPFPLKHSMFSSPKKIKVNQPLLQENVQLKSHLADSEESLADVKSKLVSVNSDKERYFQEKLDLHQRVQQLSHDKEHLYKVRNVYLEQNNVW